MKWMDFFSSKVSLALALLCLAAGTPFALRGMWDYWEIRADEVKASPARIWTGKSRGRGGYRYYANYEFADERDVVWRGRQDIDFDLYNILNDSVPDTKFRISYARRDPSKNAIELDAMRKSSAISVIIVAVAWGFVIAGYYYRRRARVTDAILACRALEVDHSISAPPPAESAPPKFGRWRRGSGRQI